MLLAALAGATAGCPSSGNGPGPASDAAGADGAGGDAVRRDPADAGRSAEVGYGEPGSDAGRPGVGVPGSDGAPGPAAPVDGGDVTTGDAPRPAPDASGLDARPAPGSYAAAVIYGGLNRLVIVKSDPARNLCFRLTLRAPDTDSALPLRLPDSWQVESAGATDRASDCAAGALPPPPVSAATAGSGSVSWTGQMPCLVDVDVTLWFTTPGLPREEILRVRALVPSGC
jgi:hypothetical protein